MFVSNTLELNETSSMHLLFSITIFLISLMLLYKWFSSSSSVPTANKSSSPPSPPKLPIIGNFHQLGLHPPLSLQTLARRHGPLMLLHFGSVPVLVVSSAELAYVFLKTNDLAFSDRPRLMAFAKLVYNFRYMSMAPYGEYWRQVRSISVLHLLGNKMVQSFRSVREEETKAMVDTIQECCCSSSPTKAMMNLTNDIVCRVALGRKYGDGGEGGRKFKKLLGEFVELLGSFFIGDYIPWLAWASYVTGLNGRAKKVAEEFDEFLDEVVQEHIDRHDRQSVGKQEYKDFIDILLHVQREKLMGFSIDRVCIKALILDMFAAGTDTTSTVLEWAMTELLRHPSTMKKLQSEVRSIAGTKTHIAEDDLEAMHYLKAVLKETLRLHPPIPLLVPRV